MLEVGIVDSHWIQGNTLYVDEEGMLKNPESFFYIEGAYQPFAGNGVIAGFDAKEGRDTDLSITVEAVRNRVRFLSN